MSKLVKILATVFGAFLLLFILVGIFGSNGSKPKHVRHAAVSSRQPTPAPTAKPSSPAPTTRTSSAGRRHHHHRSGVVLTRCRARDGGKLPDPHCTPGAVYRHVTQANIASTICTAGWTDTVRPSESYTEGLKVRQIRLYGYSTTSTSAYEEDHLIPLELGGAPYSPTNLWPQYDHGVIPNPKDRVENALNAAVCDGRVSLHAAQHAIAANWTTAESRLGVNGSGGGSAPAHTAPAHTTPAHTAPATAAPTGCHPKTSSGHCYEAGEFCRTSDAGTTGVAGNGERIVCKLNGSRYRWEPA